jgi:glyoxylase-like metal-dependent hydrolase (beta-lactamase superfamily II)
LARVFALVLALALHGQNGIADVLPQPELIAEGGGSLFGGRNPMQLWDLEKITDDIYGFRYTFYRTIFIVTPDGVIAADPINPKAAAVLRQQIRNITDKPVRYVTYSHSHWDHIGGGQVFKEEGAKIVAQERCAENFRENPNPVVAIPDITYKDRYTIELGGKSVTMHYFGPTHDNCLVVMHIKPENLMFVVDIANPPSGWIMFYNPAVSEDRVWNMVPALNQVVDLIDREGVETIIGGHMTTNYDPQTGRPTIVRGTIGPAGTVAERRDYWLALITGARTEMEAGTPADEIPDKLVADGYMSDRVKGYDGDKMRILFRRMVAFLQTGE